MDNEFQRVDEPCYDENPPPPDNPSSSSQINQNSETAAPHYAGVLRRAVAMGIDCVIITAFVYFTWRAALSLTEESGLLFYIGLVFYTFLFPFAYFVYFHAVGGQTPGKMALGIKVVEQSGSEAGTLRSIFRALGYSFSFIFFLAGFAWPLFDPRRQGWHDKIAGTVVLEI